MNYSDLIRQVSINLNENEEARIQKIRINETGEVEIRPSWWKNGTFMLRPLDLNEEDWLKLIKLAIEDRIFSDEFIKELKEVLK